MDSDWLGDGPSAQNQPETEETGQKHRRLGWAWGHCIQSPRSWPFHRHDFLCILDHRGSIQVNAEIVHFAALDVVGPATLELDDGLGKGFDAERLDPMCLNKTAVDDVATLSMASELRRRCW